MIELYRRLLARVRSVNELNRLHISMENRFAPRHVLEFDPGTKISPAGCLLRLQGPASLDSPLTLGEDLLRRSEDWRADVIAKLALALKPEPEKFERRRLLRDVFAYSDGRPQHGKRLLILFAADLRPMMQVFQFLQNLDARATDVLFLRDPSRSGYRKGLWGAGSSMDDVIQAIPKLIDLTAYVSVSTFGVSAGGLPALAAGLSYGAKTVTAAGPNHPDDERLQGSGRPFRSILRQLRGGPGRRTEVFVLWGQYSYDQPNAEAIAADLGATVIRVTDPRVMVYHGAVFPLARQHRLEAILKALMHGGPPGLDRLREMPTLDVRVIERAVSAT